FSPLITISLSFTNTAPNGSFPCSLDFKARSIAFLIKYSLFFVIVSSIIIIYLAEFGARDAGRTGIVQPPEIDDSHARQWSTAQESLIPTRGSSPPLRNRGFPRAGVVHRSEIAESRAQEWSTAQKLLNPERGSGPPLRNR